MKNCGKMLAEVGEFQPKFLVGLVKQGIVFEKCGLRFAKI
jgi:hypothetical protein